MIVSRGTTPTCTFRLPNTVDLSIANHVYVTFSKLDHRVIFTKSDEDLTIEANLVHIFLTQEETLNLPDKFEVQMNWTYLDGHKVKRADTKRKVICSDYNLLNEVVE